MLLNTDTEYIVWDLKRAYIIQILSENYNFIVTLHSDVLCLLNFKIFFRNFSTFLRKEEILNKILTNFQRHSALSKLKINV